MDSRLLDSPIFAPAGQGHHPHARLAKPTSGALHAEYHALKGKTPSLAFFKNPEMAAQATLDAQRILGVDAAIMFADLLPMLEPMGLELDYLEGVGPPVLPIRSHSRRPSPPSSPGSGGRHGLHQRYGAVLPGRATGQHSSHWLCRCLYSRVYAVEGWVRNYLHCKRLMNNAPEAWGILMDSLWTR